MRLTDITRPATTVVLYLLKALKLCNVFKGSRIRTVSKGHNQEKYFHSFLVSEKYIRCFVETVFFIFILIDSFSFELS